MHLGTSASVGRIDQRAAPFRLEAVVSDDVNETLAADDPQSSAPAPSRALASQEGSVRVLLHALANSEQETLPELRRGGSLQRPDPRATNWLAPRLGLA